MINHQIYYLCLANLIFQSYICSSLIYWHWTVLFQPFYPLFAAAVLLIFGSLQRKALFFLISAGLIVLATVDHLILYFSNSIFSMYLVPQFFHWANVFTVVCLLTSYELEIISKSLPICLSIISPGESKEEPL